MNLTKEEAAAALATVARSQEALRQAFRARRGHYHLWLWGVIWIAMALSAHFGGPKCMRSSLTALGFAGGLGSFLIGRWQGGQVRMPVDRRFVAALVSLPVFGLVWPLVLQPVPTPERMFTYISLIVAQCYVVAGIWFDTYLVWLGLLLAGLLLTGFWFFLPIFWIWVAVCCGGALLLGGCYVRYYWR